MAGQQRLQRIAGGQQQSIPLGGARTGTGAGLAPMPVYAEQPVQSAPKKKAQERAKAAAAAAA